jgi:hypothetical protein
MTLAQPEPVMQSSIDCGEKELDTTSLGPDDAGPTTRPQHARRSQRRSDRPT